MKGLNIKITSHCLIGWIKTNAIMFNLMYKDAKVNSKVIEKGIEADTPWKIKVIWTNY